MTYITAFPPGYTHTDAISAPVMASLTFIRFPPSEHYSRHLFTQNTVNAQNMISGAETALVLHFFSGNAIYKVITAQKRYYIGRNRVRNAIKKEPPGSCFEPGGWFNFMFSLNDVAVFIVSFRQNCNSSSDGAVNNFLDFRGDLHAGSA